MTQCNLCQHSCNLAIGQTGFCNARRNVDGHIKCINYGKITSLALEPIEKKPLKKYKSGSMVLSVSSFGCNFRCPFCQNHNISICNEATAHFIKMTPEELVQAAKNDIPKGNIGLAFTYNEPLVGYEFVRDTTELIRAEGMDNILVTNGCINSEMFNRLLPLINAVNIDLKSFSPGFYKNINGDFELVKQNIISAANSSCHLEVTNLIIPGVNDSENEMYALTSWIAGINPQIPLHITRFYPRYQMEDKSPTSSETLRRLATVAKRKLETVFYSM